MRMCSAVCLAGNGSNLPSTWSHGLSMCTGGLLGIIVLWQPVYLIDTKAYQRKLSYHRYYKSYHSDGTDAIWIWNRYTKPVTWPPSYRYYSTERFCQRVDQCARLEGANVSWRQEPITPVRPCQCGGACSLLWSTEDVPCAGFKILGKQTVQSDQDVANKQLTCI